jgi:asparagine synthase (glutamine-hydrolysing)
MCGIAGLLTGRPQAVACLTEAARAMSDAIAHRGPDGRGVWVDAEAGAALGHRRLAVIDLTEAGAQPMISTSGRYVISFNGEIYNFEGLRDAVEQARGGHQWRGHSDTEVLLEAIDLWGLAPALRRIDGMFALAVWDRSARALSLARDRFGEKPLYYGTVDRQFLFGSELRALRAVADLGEADIEVNSLEWLFQTSYIPTPLSIFRGVHKLPPGLTLTITSADVVAGREPDVRSYWDAADVARRSASTPFIGDDEAMTDRLQSLLEQSISRRMVADVPIGAMLSGGVDSAGIVAVAQSIASTPMKTFTVGFEDSAHDESAQAAAIAAALGTDHTTLHLGAADILKAVEAMATVYDEPFADSSQVPTYLICQSLRRDVTVALSGDAGDELFGGYNRHIAGEKIWRGLQRVPLQHRRLISGAVRLAGGEALITLGAGLAGVRGEAAQRWQKASRLIDAGSENELYLRLISHWCRGTVVSTGRDWAPALLNPDYLAGDDNTLTRRMMLNDTLGYLPNDILTKVDRASMAVSLEARVPFLSPDLFEFAWSLPTGRLVQNGVGKMPLRRLANRYLPEGLMKRQKQGFSMPVGTWLRGPLKAWAADLLSPERLRASGRYNFKVVEKAWRDHQSGIDNASGLWSILMFEAWRDTLGRSS